MKLDYNILWIDNDLQNYIDNGSVKDVEDFLMEKGFEPNIEKVFDEANLDNSINKFDYDLIISDYNLENTTGDLVIKDIRENKRLDTEILFYTAKSSYRNDPQVIERLAFIERLTFWVGRDGLLDKIERVIGLTLKKLLELNATRGLITAATSHLDVEIEEIILILIKKNGVQPEVLDGFVKSKIYEPLEKRFRNCFDFLQKLEYEQKMFITIR
jgi:CheY-like chemotaxis protein